MVFSSVPVYLDSPNWHHQQPNYHHQGTAGENPQLPPLPSAPHVVGFGGGGGGGLGGSGSIRPGSKSDRARITPTQAAEAPLKCPRCDSSNTKFCYFNNYSLSQPRYFCKTCRRYWTKGGALRSVPVGGGCRRNKKTKSKSSSRSSSKSTPQMGSSNSTSTLIPSELTSQIPLMASLHNLPQYNIGNIGLNFGVGSSQSTELGFQIGTNSAGGDVQQFPFIEHAPNTGLYSFQCEGINHQASSSLVGDDNQLRYMASNARVSEHAPLKMEDHHQGLNLSFLGISENNQYWSETNWTDLSAGLNNPSSKNHPL